MFLNLLAIPAWEPWRTFCSWDVTAAASQASTHSRMISSKPRCETNVYVGATQVGSALVFSDPRSERAKFRTDILPTYTALLPVPSAVKQPMLLLRLSHKFLAQNVFQEALKKFLRYTECLCCEVPPVLPLPLSDTAILIL